MQSAGGSGRVGEGSASKKCVGVSRTGNYGDCGEVVSARLLFVKGFGGFLVGFPGRPKTGVGRFGKSGALVLNELQDFASG